MPLHIEIAQRLPHWMISTIYFSRNRIVGGGHPRLIAPAEWQHIGCWSVKFIFICENVGRYKPRVKKAGPVNADRDPHSPRGGTGVQARLVNEICDGHHRRNISNR